MFVDFSLLVVRGFRKGRSGFGEQFFPPAHFFDTCVIDVDSSIECLYGTLTCLFMFPLNHEINLFELIFDLLEDGIVLYFQSLLIFSHFNINIFDPLQLLIQNP